MAIRRHRGAAAADRLMRDALIVELQQDGETPDGERIAKIRLVARRLIDKAVDGEAAAIKEIFDRIDGRAGTAADVAAHTRRPWPTCASNNPISGKPEIGGLTHEETLDLLD